MIYTMTNLHFETDSPVLEQFLLLHDIRAYRTYQNPLNRTMWVYHRTKDLVRVVEEWYQLLEKRNACSRVRVE